MRNKLFRGMMAVVALLAMAVTLTAGCASAMGNTYQEPGAKAGKGLKYYESHYQNK